jgi:hypothetical protein
MFSQILPHALFAEMRPVRLSVVFTPEELKYWDRNITPRTPFTPTLVHLESEYEPHILLRNAVEILAAAHRKEN